MTKFEEMFIKDGCISAVRTLTNALTEWGGNKRDTLLASAVVDVIVAHLACKCHMYDYLYHSEDASPDEVADCYTEIMALVQSLRIYEDNVRGGVHRVVPFLDDNDVPRTDFNWS